MDIINDIDKFAQRAIEAKNNELLQDINFYRNQGDTKSINQAIEIAKNLYINPDKKEAMLQMLNNDLDIAMTIDNIKSVSFARRGLNPKELQLLTKSYDGKPPKYINNLRNYVAMKALTELEQAYKTGDLQSVYKVMNNIQPLQPILQKWISTNLSDNDKLEIVDTIKKLGAINPNIYSQTSALFKPKDFFMYATLANQKALYEQTGRAFDLQKAKQEFQGYLSGNLYKNKDYQKFYTEMRDKFGGTLTDDEIASAYIASQHNIDPEEIFESFIKSNGVFGRYNIRYEVSPDNFDTDSIFSTIDKITKVTKTSKSDFDYKVVFDGSRYLVIPLNKDGLPVVVRDNNGIPRILAQPIEATKE
jgi:hypothetical protein